MQIHELNNFTGTLGSGAYLAIDDGTDTGKISSQGLLAATEARIDNIIAGPAPSAEEIVDARLGADGVTYPSLGDAIRDQFTDVKSALNDFFVPKIDESIFEIGTLLLMNGTNYPSTTRLRTIAYLPVLNQIKALNGYSFIVYAYSNNIYIGEWNPDANDFEISSNVPYWLSEFDFAQITTAYDYRIVLRKNDDSEITTAQANNLILYRATDDSLSLDNKSADAKAVGRFVQMLTLGYKSMSESSRIELFKLSDITTFTYGSAINSSGNIVNSSGSYCTEYYIELDEGMDVSSIVNVISSSAAYYHYIAFYDNSYGFISRSGGLQESNVTTVVPTNAKYCRISLTYIGENNVSSYGFVAYYMNVLDKSPKNKWYVLGDSISAGYYSLTESMAEEAGVTMSYISPVTTEQGEVTGSVWDSSLAHNYWGYANQWYLGRELVGKAYPGQGYFRTASNSQNGVYVVDHNDFSDAGFITVAWGFNDWHYNEPRGNHNLIDNSIPVPTDNFDTSQITTVNHAIWYCLGRLIKKAPKAKIVVQTPMNGWAYGGDFSTNWSIGYSMSQSDKLKDIHDDIIYWCDYYGLQYIDMTFNNSIVNRVNIKDTIIDGSHPSDEAHKQLARSVWTKIGY